MEVKAWIPEEINSSTALRIAGLLAEGGDVVHLIAEEIVRKDARIAELEAELESCKRLAAERLYWPV